MADGGTHTNALEYVRVYSGDHPHIPLGRRIKVRLHRIRRLFGGEADDFNWAVYPLHYRAEHAFNRRYFTDDLREVEFTFRDGKLYLLSDCKPLSPPHRCLMEAICNLRGVKTIAEIGVGGGRYLASLQAILGEGVELSGYDLSPGQLAFFRDLFPDVFSRVHTGILDVTSSAIPAGVRPDVVYASTVLMHIQREDAYQRALGNFLASAGSFAVLMDDWQSHSYYRDLTDFVSRDSPRRLYVYDSGASVAAVVSLNGAELPAPYMPLTSPSMLDRYRNVA
ncbi:MAG TPA: class I SAM-dependent methyltransferase [Thermoanaerobaculia bacterium]|jgi:hypothetical protein